MHNPIQSNNSFGQIHVESRMEIRIISRSVWYHENVQTQDSLIFDKFLIQWRMFKIVLFLLYFTLIVQENSYHSLDQSYAKFTKITNWSPAFPALEAVWLFFFDFSLALQGIFPSSDWLLLLHQFCFYDTQSKSALNNLLSYLFVKYPFTTWKPHGYFYNSWTKILPLNESNWSCTPVYTQNSLTSFMYSSAFSVVNICYKLL